MTEIPDDILDRATQTFHTSLRENQDYTTAVADALSIAAPLFAAHEFRRQVDSGLACPTDETWLIDRATELEAGAS